MGGLDLRLQAIDLALRGLQVAGVLRAERGKGGFGGGQRGVVGVDGALGGLADVVRRAVHERLELRLSGREADFGGLVVFGPTAAPHTLQPRLLLGEAGLRRRDVFGAGSGLQSGQARLRLRQSGAGLEDLHPRVVLVEHDQRVAGFNLGTGVDQHLLDAAGGLRQHVDLLTGADLAAVRQLLLNVAALHAVGGDCDRGRRLRRDWRRGRCLATRRQKKGAEQGAAEDNSLSGSATEEMHGGCRTSHWNRLRLVVASVRSGVGTNIRQVIGLWPGQVDRRARDGGVALSISAYTAQIRERLGACERQCKRTGVEMAGWLMLLPVGGLGWWLLGFPPGWGWIVVPMIPAMPVSLGMLLVLATVVIGAYGGLVWVRNNF